MNRIILIGRTTADPIIKVGSNDSKVAKFAIAVNRRVRKDQEQQTDFFNCTAFGRQAEFIEKYLKKGTKMMVEGHVENYQYLDREGRKLFGTNVIVEEMEFVERKKEESSEPKTDESGFMTIPDGIEEEMPFV